MRIKGWLEAALLVVCFTSAGCTGQQTAVNSGNHVQAESEIETQAGAGIETQAGGGIETTELLEASEQADDVTDSDAAKSTTEDATLMTEHSEFTTQETEDTVSSDDEPLQMEVLTIDEPVYTFTELSQQLKQQGVKWEAYYNGSGEQITMYCENGAELLFLRTGENTAEVDLDKAILVMEKELFHEAGFLTGYQSKLTLTADSQYYPQTAEYDIHDTELTAMNDTDLKIALNEIYARHGKQITDPFLHGVFSLKAWYDPRYTETDFADKQQFLLNQYEKENVKILLDAQKQRGFVSAAEGGGTALRSIVPGSDIDLDGDGTKEHIFFSFMYAGPYNIAKKCRFIINPKASNQSSLASNIEGMTPAVYGICLDGKTTQLITCGVMDDGTPRTDIYAYTNGKIELMGKIDANNLEIGPDCFWAYQYDAQKLNQVRVKYIFKDGAVVDTGSGLPH